MPVLLELKAENASSKATFCFKQPLRERFKWAKADIFADRKAKAKVAPKKC